MADARRLKHYTTHKGGILIDAGVQDPMGHRGACAGSIRAQIRDTRNALQLRNIYKASLANATALATACDSIC